MVFGSIKVRMLGVKSFFALFLVVLMLFSAVLFLVALEPAESDDKSASFYVGVTFCLNTTADARVLIDRVKTYTNLFVLQSGPVSKNETAVNEICDYAVAAGLHIIVYFGWFDPAYPWQLPWLDFAKQRYGNQFLGVYYYDEPGGIQLDYNWSGSFSRLKMRNSDLYQAHAPSIEAYLNGSTHLRDYDASAKLYTNIIGNDSGLLELKKHSITTFTSEYALYWFDYLAGYDVLLTQFGWNDTLTQNIALVRGAARVQNKTWGAMITWKYDEPPYLDTGDEIYQQMLMAYDAGAKYVAIFNYANDTNGTFAIMRDEHFEALEKFWNYLNGAKQDLPRSAAAEAVLVLPRNYGWGMRRPEDRLWYWGPDEKSPQIWEQSRVLLSEYGLRLDIVYDDPSFPVQGKYGQVFYWNSPTPTTR